MARAQSSQRYWRCCCCWRRAQRDFGADEATTPRRRRAEEALDALPLTTMGSGRGSEEGVRRYSADEELAEAARSIRLFRYCTRQRGGIALRKDTLGQSREVF